MKILKGKVIDYNLTEAGYFAKSYVIEKGDYYWQVDLSKLSPTMFSIDYSETSIRDTEIQTYDTDKYSLVKSELADEIAKTGIPHYIEISNANFSSKEEIFKILPYKSTWTIFDNLDGLYGSIVFENGIKYDINIRYVGEELILKCKRHVGEESQLKTFVLPKVIIPNKSSVILSLLIERSGLSDLLGHSSGIVYDTLSDFVDNLIYHNESTSTSYVGKVTEIESDVIDIKNLGTGESMRISLDDEDRYVKYYFNIKDENRDIKVTYKADRLLEETVSKLASNIGVRLEDFEMTYIKEILKGKYLKFDSTWDLKYFEISYRGNGRKIADTIMVEL